MKQKNMNRYLPAEGLSPDHILGLIDKMQKEDIAWQKGRTWSLVYHAGQEHDQLLKSTFGKYFSTNYLNPFAFPSLQHMEKEVVRMTASMLNGDDEVVGTMSSGGTESILLALYTYREWARKHHPHIENPEIVAPQTIHPAHDKAAHLLGLRIRKAPADEGQCAQPMEMERLISENTILLVASAPSYPNGILDPISAIGELARKYRLPLHVDACIGGFMLPWIERLGTPLDPWDFRVSAVTSISADVHKFGFGSKGASVVLYRTMDLLKHQFYITTDFPGGIYVSPTILGSRSGGPIAAAWAGMKHLGESGYLKVATRLMQGTKKLQKGLDAIPEIRIIGQPCMNIVSFTTHHNTPDIFAVAEHLQTRGWMVDRQQMPDCIHLTVLPTNVGVIDKYLTDLRLAVNHAKTHRKGAGEGTAALYGMMARVPFRGIVRKNVRKIFEEIYSGDEVPSGTRLSSVPPDGSALWMGLVSRMLAWWRRIFPGRNA